MSKACKCDICGKLYEDLPPYPDLRLYRYQDPHGEHRLDLCDECQKNLERFVGGTKIDYDSIIEDSFMEWISVKDRLPRCNVPVLVYRPSMAAQILVDEYRGFWDEDAADWCEDWALYGKHNGKDIITHWMPLPEPPKEDNL